MPQNLISCPSCQRDCIPRLWHYRPMLGNFRYMKTQHLCPFCGAVMFETGGRLSIQGIIAVFLILIPIGLGLVSDFIAKQIGTNPKDTLTVFFIGYICFLVAVVIRTIYRELKPLVIKVINKIKNRQQA